ncbi:MAG: hypothetical protein ACI8W8_003522 [Rhodothermales bacterium]|jgi:hypothetical protein
MPKQCRFTLVEIIVVITIIAILIALLLPSVKTVRDKSKQVICFTNLRSMGQAIVLYTANNDRFMPYCNWDPLDPVYVKGWLYSSPSRSAASDVEAGSLWPYLYERDIYHCPMHDDHEKTGDIQRLTSYIMSGMLQHYGSSSEWFRYSDFPGDGIAMWEENEYFVRWNDGANFTTEGSPQLSFRHFGRASVLSFSGGVEPWYSTEYDAEKVTASAEEHTRVLYCPLKDAAH